MSLELAAVLFGFVVLPLGCVLVERLWPAIETQRTFRAGFSSDVVWYFAQTLVSRLLAPWIVVFALLPVFFAIGHPLTHYWAGFGPIAALPLGWQMLIAFVVGDFLSYWSHRLFHLPALWPAHAVHHSSKEVDWLSAGRFHPLNEIGGQLIYLTPVLACGLSPLAYVILAPFTASYAVFLHANVDWRFGPLRTVIASPTFHRWHHTTATQARDKNFAGYFPVWDILFGTFYFPDTERPERFGVEDGVPDGFGRQLVYPLARWLGRAT